jgi:subtilisin family serine protease
VVGVIDTGVDYNHPDLDDNIWSNPGGVGSPSCGVGTHGYDAYDNDCTPMDQNDHGTHVSGTIGAEGNNGAGVVGVNWDVSIMGLRFLSPAGSGSTADAIDSINWAIDAKNDGVNLRVLNNSWGGGGFSSALQTAITNATNAGILFVAAAGNSGSNNDNTPFYPCNYANTVCVAATTSTDGRASFSNYGATTVDLGAPGVGIDSTVIGGGYDNTFSGTSMATPHVAGAAALILSQQPNLTVSQLRSALLAAVDQVSSLAGKTVTGGRLNVCKAIIGCAGGGGGGGDFTISASPSIQKIKQGRNKSYTVTVTPSGGFTGTVALGISGKPANTSHTFTPSSITGGGGTSSLKVSPATNAPLGTYTLTITGTSGSLVHSTSVQLKVKAP